MHALLNNFFEDLLTDLSGLDSTIVLLAMLIIVAVVVLDAVGMAIRRRHKQAGLSPTTVTKSIDGSKTVPLRDYVSEIQGLAGKPDALIRENGYVIPIERKPLARKIRDRYVAQLLVYMRLVEEFEGKKPPYGYLILGANCRKIKIDNTSSRQEWLQKILDEMRGVLEHRVEPIATPQRTKCKKCDVRLSCAFRYAEPDEADIAVHSIGNGTNKILL